MALAPWVGRLMTRDESPRLLLDDSPYLQQQQQPLLLLLARRGRAALCGSISWLPPPPPQQQHQQRGLKISIRSCNHKKLRSWSPWLQFPCPA
jgi:hypothetical protein